MRNSIYVNLYPIQKPGNRLQDLASKHRNDLKNATSLACRGGIVSYEDQMTINNQADALMCQLLKEELFEHGLFVISQQGV